MDSIYSPLKLKGPRACPPRIYGLEVTLLNQTGGLGGVPLGMPLLRKDLPIYLLSFESLKIPRVYRSRICL
jgi:hypothetical protein